MTTKQSSLRFRPRTFADIASYRRWLDVQSRGFTRWYVDPTRNVTNKHRVMENARAVLYPDHLLAASVASEDWSATLNSVPARWSGDADDLHQFEQFSLDLNVQRKVKVALSAGELFAETFHSERLYRALMRPIANARMRKANTTVLLAIHVDPSQRGSGVAPAVLRHVIASSTSRGFDFVLGPFRPSDYGSWKKERGIAHTAEAFTQYCEATRPDGLPLDGWFRNLKRQDVTFMKPEPEALTVVKSREAFDRFRASHRPSEWYEPERGVWECGETQTWLLRGDRVASIEPNYWGAFPLTASARATLAAANPG